MSNISAAQLLPTRLPEIGELVQVRSRRWLVEEVVESDTPPESALVRLACADDDAQGQSLDVFWDYELDRRILEEEGWEDLAAKGFDAPRQFAAFLHTLRWNCVTATDPNLFQAPFRAGIKIDAYQMEPLRKALRLPRVNLFIADDTGLGKTIEAGLIARELLLRKKAKTIVVAAPPSVLEQWKGELEERFGLVFEILDRAYLTRMRRERGFGVNPWRTHSRFLVSHNLLIDATYADPLREWLGPMLPGSLLILDEAHHAAPASGGRYGIETKFTRAVRDLCGPLRAPPVPLGDAAQRPLEQLLDAARAARPLPLHPRRQGAGQEGPRRRDGPPPQGGHPRGPGRLPEAASSSASRSTACPTMRRSSCSRGSSTSTARAREERFASTSQRAQAAAGLLVVGLQQRLLSSIEAFARSLKVHRATVERQWEKAQRSAGRGCSKPTTTEASLFTTAPDADDERGELDGRGARGRGGRARSRRSPRPPRRSRPRDASAEALWRREQALLDQMQEIAEKTRHLPDAKTRRLIDWIRENLCPDLPPFGQAADGRARRSGTTAAS